MMRAVSPASRRLGWIGAALVVAALVVLGRVIPYRAWVEDFARWIAGLGPAAYVLFVLAYVLVTVLMMPAILLTLTAGFVFGLGRGFAITVLAATCGCAASFLIARHLARERVARYAGGNPRYSAIDRAIGREGWRIVFLLRLSPLVPFVFSNYFYGLTAIRFWPYVFASLTGMLPLTFLYVSFGVAARGALVEAAGPPDAWKWALLAAGIVVTTIATLYATKVVKRALEDEGVPGVRPSPRPPLPKGEG
jgi:uncharacterized membrane protein YdjX (TVP38/TMEM64 family)